MEVKDGTDPLSAMSLFERISPAAVRDSQVISFFSRLMFLSVEV